ncbi:MAG: hypothetical protein ACI9W4_003048 [Rhodothermales bacterium]|jgi:hypothetical protein
MNRSLSPAWSAVMWAIPPVLVLTVVLVALSPQFEENGRALSLAVTLDLLLTVPFVYWLLVRRTKIPSLTTIPVFVLGILLAGIILPPENQQLLSLAKVWVLPLVEVGVALLVFFKGRAAWKNARSRSATNPDMFSVLVGVCSDIFPERLAYLAATEIGMFYYGFCAWKKPTLGPAQFTGYRTSGTIAVLSILLMMIVVEMTALHFLVALWSSLAAWILTGLSLYAGLQVFGFARSLTRRPIEFEDGQLILRYGLLSQTSIQLDNIDSIDLSKKAVMDTDKTAFLSPLSALEKHNVVLGLKKPETLIGPYGTKTSYSTIAFHVDERERFDQHLRLARK